MADTHSLTRHLQKNNGSKIVLLVSDGVGGLPLEPGGADGTGGGQDAPFCSIVSQLEMKEYLP